jgi:hypothetical protein
MINPKGAHVLVRIRWAGGPEGGGHTISLDILGG